MNKIISCLLENCEKATERQRGHGIKYTQLQKIIKLFQQNIKIRCKSKSQCKGVIQNMAQNRNNQWLIKLNKYIQSKTKRNIIVTRCIKFQNIEQIDSWQTKFKKLKKIKANYRVLLSLNPQTNIHVQNLQKEENQKQNTNILIEKAVNASHTKNIDIYEREIKIIQLLKFVECKGIALHYIQYNQIEQKNINKYYNQFYSRELEISKGFTAKYFFDLFKSLINSVRILHERGIRHRDLKPGNIMIDCGEDPKIIDFGSALYINPAQTKQICGNIQLLTTKSYNITYDYAQIDKDEIKEQQFNQHQLFDIYAIGVLLMKCLLQIDQQISNSLKKKFSYLILSSMRHNPNERMQPDQFLYLLILLQKIWKTENNQP